MKRVFLLVLAGVVLTVFGDVDPCVVCGRKFLANTCKLAEDYLKESVEDLVEMDIPNVHCKDSTLINFNWKENKDFFYFLEIMDLSDKTVSFTNLIKCNNITVTDLKADTYYRIRTWGIDSEVNQITGRSNYTEVKTHPLNFTRKQVDTLKLKHIVLRNDRYDGVVEWETTTDKNCYFNIVWFEGMEMDDYTEVILDEPSQPHELTLERLKMGSNCSIAIMTTSADLRIESNKTWHHFLTPTCLETFRSLEVCRPETPINLTVEEFLVDVNPLPTYNVKLKWKKPIYQPDYYSAYLAPLRKFTRKVINVTGEVTEITFNNMELEPTYHVSLFAWSKPGRSPPAFSHKNVDINAPALSALQYWGNIKLILSIVCPIVIVVITLILVVYINSYLNRRSRLEQRCKYFKELEQSVPAINEDVILEDTTDEWEISPKKLIFQTKLGEGAFGIVRRAWFEDQNNGKIEVAIKMLKDMPSQQDLREFHQEIEIMKTVGSHPHLVSLIGCITKGRPEGPLLIVEYCERGDLQTFLRTTWEQITNQTNKSSLRYMNEPGIGKQTEVHFTNKMYDADKILLQDKFTLQAVDLLSYGRQIAVGMDYLSTLRVLHRDLAARNILVCKDGRTIKISDFGLSRDVYQNNIYCKTGNGKLPVRWMALESMTHQRYTTQSDVWSFGILLWEIITLGGNPYPGVSNQDLLPLLKEGYRMEKPINCTNEVYSIMMQCWRHSPKERPTFTELTKTLDSLLEKDAEYINIDINSPPSQNVELTICSSRSSSSEGYVRPIKI